jgi:hypothetical protein
MTRRKVTPTKKKVLAEELCGALLTIVTVQLVELSRKDCQKPLYGVTFPQNIGGLDGLPICEQFMSLDEARKRYITMVKFFKERARRNASFAP